MPEHAVCFSNARGEQLVGVFHEPIQPARGAILMFHGWSGTRTGPHQMLTRAARRFVDEGYACLRFDFAGRGDSDGDTELATLATMREDSHAALELLKSRIDGPIWMLGLCSGCEIAVAAADDSFAGALLWSAPVFAALPSGARQSKKRAENLKRYARKLLNPATYLKVLRGEVDKGAVAKAMAGQGGAAHKNVESNQSGSLPPGFRRARLEAWKRFDKPILQVYGSADPIVDEARNWYREHSFQAPEVLVIEGANHSFYGLEWERDVIEKTMEWLKLRN